MSFTQPYGQKNYLGEFDSDSACVTFINASKWDTDKDGKGDPEEGMWYTNNTDHVFRAYLNGVWANIGGGGVSDAWRLYGEEITRISDTSFSVTDNADAQATFKPGRPMYAVLQEAAGNRYLLVTAYSSGTVTVAGMLPAGITDEVYWADFTRVVQVDFSVQGALPNSSTDDLIADENKAAFRWQRGTAHMVRCLGYLYDADSGSAGEVAPMIEGANALTADLAVGTSKVWAETADEINAGNAEIDQDEDLDVKWSPGSGADASDLTVSMAFILE